MPQPLLPCHTSAATHRPTRQRRTRLVIELAVHVASEQGGPDLWQHLAGQQVQPRLQRVHDLDPAALGVHLHPATPGDASGTQVRGDIPPGEIRQQTGQQNGHCQCTF